MFMLLANLLINNSKRAKFIKILSPKLFIILKKNIVINKIDFLRNLDVSHNTQASSN